MANPYQSNQASSRVSPLRLNREDYAQPHYTPRERHEHARKPPTRGGLPPLALPPIDNRHMKREA